ncbi:unnamed protein product [Litomosoides sigmodontis]|uniref:Uncharacterized protein n=1 Tax=Litomosoides sigmodontis TaxID=42156 RepID=A0A3P6SF06_LITSI|nr:unnamed protein product [Litomosoides sigmodontis]
MKLLNELKSKNAPFFAGILYDSSLSSEQRTFEYPQCDNHVPVTSVGTTDTTLATVTATAIVILNCSLTEPRPELELDDIQSYDVDELSRVTADIAAENPDMIRFQQVLNSWT